MKEVKTRLLDLLDGAQKACFQQKAPVSNKKRRISYSVQHRPTKLIIIYLSIYQLFTIPIRLSKPRIFRLCWTVGRFFTVFGCAQDCLMFFFFS